MQFAGRLVDNAQLRTTNSGKQVTGFSVALNENYKDKNGSKMQKTTYVDCSYWNRPNITPHLTKGLLVEVTGFPSARVYTTKSGESRAVIDFRVDRLDFLGRAKSNTVDDSKNQKSSSVNSESFETTVPTISDDDLPF